MILEHQTIHLFDKLLFEKAKAVPPIRLPNLMHHEACFLYVLEGKCTAVSATEAIKAQPPDALLMKCGNFFNFCEPNPEHPHYHAIAVHFHPDVLKKVYKNELPGFLKPSTSSTSTFARVATTELVTKYIESVIFYFQHPELVSEELLCLKVREIMLLLSQTERGSMVRQILSDLFSPVSVQMKEVVEAHILSDMTVNELAVLCHMSESSFKRKFKKQYGVAPATYIRSRKLQRAKELIESAGLSVAQAAFESGFNDLAHFSRAFKEKFGIPPSAARPAK